MSLITNTQEFNTHKKKVSELFSLETAFEDNLFKDNMKHFIAFDFDYIFEEVFFDGVKEFLQKTNESGFNFYTLSPSPEEYYYKQFKKYSTFNINVNQAYKDLYDNLYEDPGENTGNYIGVISNEVVLLSDSHDWAIVGSRDLEIAICGFSNLEIKNKFENSFGKNQNIFSKVNEYIKDLNNMLTFNKEQWTFYNKILNSYK